MADAAAGNPQAVDDGGTPELTRVPAWEVKYRRGQNPDELAHLVCCRDLDWRRAFCGYEDPDPAVLLESNNVCAMCIEAAGGMEGPAATLGICPVDDRPCPDDETLRRIIDERMS
ncbi:hypothetical protein [Arthrobacter celericrescens]|uniref:hypothetical protein n=1 Tax=Arthrobacter celericrescens TaxID=2320851 RepID=UPI000EA3BB8A|nr:hypothetical protein [Arthrobacter celericrescens]